MVHISQLADYRAPTVESVVKLGDEVMVMVTDVDPQGKIRLSRRAVLEGLTPEQARYHPYSNVITRCVGANAAVEDDVLQGELQNGDLYLICSDGLTGMVEDPQLRKILETRQTPGRMVDAIVAAPYRADRMPGRAPMPTLRRHR